MLFAHEERNSFYTELIRTFLKLNHNFHSPDEHRWRSLGLA